MQPDLNDCAGEFLETGMITPGRMRAVDENAQALGVTGSPTYGECRKGPFAVGARILPGGGPYPLRPGQQRRRRDGGCPVPPARRGHRRLLSRCRHPQPLLCPSAAALRGSRVSLHPFQSTDDLRALAPLFAKADVIVDALLGTGAEGIVKEPLATCVAMANASPAQIVAADIPSPGMRPTGSAHSTGLR